MLSPHYRFISLPQILENEAEEGTIRIMFCIVYEVVVENMVHSATKALG